MLRKVATFCKNEQELKKIYTTFCRIVLEQSCELWAGNLTKDNIDDLERCQKAAMKIIMTNNIPYHKALEKLNIDTLEIRREKLTLKWAKKATKHDKIKYLFPLKKSTHTMDTRLKNKYEITNANTERLRRSSINYMQRLLNKENIENNV